MENNLISTIPINSTPAFKFQTMQTDQENTDTISSALKVDENYQKYNEIKDEKLVELEPEKEIKFIEGKNEKKTKKNNVNYLI